MKSTKILYGFPCITIDNTKIINKVDKYAYQEEKQDDIFNIINNLEDTKSKQDNMMTIQNRKTEVNTNELLIF